MRCLLKRNRLFSGKASFLPNRRLADVQRHLGNVPLERIRACPPPGMAVESDVPEIDAREDRICEFVDGILVEKTVGTFESLLAGVLVQWFNNYLDAHPLGIALTADGMFCKSPRRIRIPDACVIYGTAFPAGVAARRSLYPFLARSGGRDPFGGEYAGGNGNEARRIPPCGRAADLVIDPEARSAVVHRADGSSESIDESGTLDGGEVLPGFSFVLRDWLDHYPRVKVFRTSLPSAVPAAIIHP